MFYIIISLEAGRADNFLLKYKENEESKLSRDI